MQKYYTNEIVVQIVISSLKKHGIRRIIVSPGSTNHTFVLSIQNDPFFYVWSCVDERSAAYMACGMATESGEPVVLSCTAATASRNYFPGLTEAYYRKLPVLALTSTRTQCQTGNLIDQQIDRTVQPKDTVKMSVQLPYVKDDEDFWECELKVNKAILELNHHGKGPVHINMPTRYDHGYDCRKLPDVRCIKRFCIGDVFPELPKDERIAVFIGSHEEMSEELCRSIDLFCERNNAVVFCEHTSGYHGKYGVNFYLAMSQQKASWNRFTPDLVIDIGEIASLARMRGKKTWRVNEDGELRDTFRTLENVFEMKEEDFFHYYFGGEKVPMVYFSECQEYIEKLRLNAVHLELPFSNVYAAQKCHNLIPCNSVIHFGILNSLRSWHFFTLPKNVKGFSNVGGYGIDGGVSTLLGASVLHPKRLYFGIFGDLCFFYDMNALGNRHLGRNVRIMLVNNGLGEEFKTFFNHCYQWGAVTNKFVAAEGHFGKKSPCIVRHYAEDLGFEYMSASNKDEFENNYKRFVVPEITDRPLFFELFTTDETENEALIKIMNIYEDPVGTAKNVAKKVLGEKGKKFVKGILGK